MGRSSASYRSKETFAILSSAARRLARCTIWSEISTPTKRPFGPGHFRRPKCHKARAAGDIQHVIARTNSCEREHAVLSGFRADTPPGALIVVRSAVPTVSLNSALEFRVHREKLVNETQRVGLLTPYGLKCLARQFA